ncbi:acetyltransferase [Legionella quinlivanii]|uniref:Acetyltransferase n=1 Tax=Legionella quinlivanii TaxID=45073 RepID=A0A364LLP1_9GAMM|nr:acetyltransferase [Legionella quinlivanii]RAP37655.1 acetyltransferase [Legionella quinlivanii]
MNKKLLVVMGFGGHARSVADVALSAGYEQLVFVDDNAYADERFLNFPVVNSYPESVTRCCLAAGDNSRRRQQMEWATSNGLEVLSVVSPHAQQSVGIQIGKGCFVGHFASIGPLGLIADGCIINTGAIIEHDCVVGEFSHISVNATVAGKVSIGKHVFVGAGAVIIDGVRIHDDVIIGAGSTVISDINEPGIYVGSPARKLLR